MLAVIQEWYRFRGLLGALVVRDLKLRYRGSLLGYAWSLANPLLQVGIYTLVFAVILKVGGPGYPAFLLGAILPWGWLSVSLLASAESIVHQRELVKRAYLPTELLPLSAVLVNGVVFLGALPVLALALAWAGHPPGAAWLALPLVVGAQLLVNVALALVCAMLNVFYRDVPYLLNAALPLWLYLSPVLYPLSAAPPSLRPWLALNPMAAILGSYRRIWLEGRFPEPGPLALAAAVGLVGCVLALSAFRRRRARFPEAL